MAAASAGLVLLLHRGVHDGEDVALALDELARLGGAQATAGRLVTEADAVLVDEEVGVLHGRGHAERRAVGERLVAVAHVVEEGRDRQVVGTAVGGLLGHELAVAVLALAPADDLGHVLAGVLGEQLLVGGHAARGEHDGLDVDLRHGAGLVDVLHAGHSVGVGEHEREGAGVGADVDALLGGDGGQLLDGRGAVAALVEGDAGLVEAAAVLAEQPVGVAAGLLHALIVQDGVGDEVGVGGRLVAGQARRVLILVLLRAVALGIVGGTAQRGVLLEHDDDGVGGLLLGDHGGEETADARADDNDVGVLGVGGGVDRRADRDALGGLIGACDCGHGSHRASRCGNAEERTTSHFSHTCAPISWGAPVP